jgi:hypothetical protein
MPQLKMKIREQLKPFLPIEGLEQLVDLIVKHKVKFKIVRPRQTKLGDYRSPDSKGYHQITVNGNLNPYSFYLTSIHEFAHLENYLLHARKVAPHGNEWKAIFSNLLHEGKSHIWFPLELQQPIKAYISSPKASSCSDPHLVQALRKFDKNSKQLPILKDLSLGAVFQLQERIFQKGETLRKRVRCKEIKTGKMYLVSSIANVKLMSSEHEK